MKKPPSSKADSAIALRGGGDGMRRLMNILAGVGRVGFVFAPREYPTYHGFAQDARSMRGDWRAIGADMRTALKKEARTRPADRGQ